MKEIVPGSPDITKFDRGALRQPDGDATASVSPVPHISKSSHTGTSEKDQTTRANMVAVERLRVITGLLVLVVLANAYPSVMRMAVSGGVILAWLLVSHETYHLMWRSWVNAETRCMEAVNRARTCAIRLRSVEEALYLELTRQGIARLESPDRLPFHDIPSEQLIYLVIQLNAGAPRLYALSRRTLLTLTYEDEQGRVAQLYFPRENGRFVNGRVTGYRTDRLEDATAYLHQVVAIKREKGK